MYSYYDGKQWIESTARQLKELAASGVVTRETLVKTPDGKTVKASQFSSLSFSDPADETLVVEDVEVKSVPVPVVEKKDSVPVKKRSSLYEKTKLTFDIPADDDEEAEPVTENQKSLLIKWGFKGDFGEMTINQASWLLDEMEQYRPIMRAYPRQRAYLRYMGYKGDVTAVSVEQASELIEQFKLRDEREGKKRFGDFDQILAEEEGKVLSDDLKAPAETHGTIPVPLHDQKQELIAKSLGEYSKQDDEQAVKSYHHQYIDPLDNTAFTLRCIMTIGIILLSIGAFISLLNSELSFCISFASAVVPFWFIFFLAIRITEILIEIRFSNAQQKS